MTGLPRDRHGTTRAKDASLISLEDARATRRRLRKGELAEVLGRLVQCEPTTSAYRVPVDDLLRAFVRVAEADGMTALQIDRSAQLILEAWRRLQLPSG